MSLFWYGMAHIWCSSKLSNFQEPHPPCLTTSKILPPPWPWTSNFKRPSLNDNQLKENIIQGWLLYVIRSSLQVGFLFQFQLINLIWLSFDFFLSSWSLTICFFVALYSCVCSCPKNLMKCLLFIIIHIFSTQFAINLYYLHKLKTNYTLVLLEPVKLSPRLVHLQIFMILWVYCS